jgi:phage gpG-like protein
MADFSSLAHFAAHLTGIVAATEHIKHHALEEAAQLVEKRAKEVIGTYDLGWPQLAESTQKEREARGFSPNEPLLRTGDLQRSIEHSVGHDEARVGSNLDVAVWQELGTKRIPPRSFLMGTAVEQEPKIREILGEGVCKKLFKA